MNIHSENNNTDEIKLFNNTEETERSKDNDTNDPNVITNTETDFVNQTDITRNSDYEKEDKRNDTKENDSDKSDASSVKHSSHQTNCDSKTPDYNVQIVGDSNAEVTNHQELQTIQAEENSEEKFEKQQNQSGKITSLLGKL